MYNYNVHVQVQDVCNCPVKAKISTVDNSRIPEFGYSYDLKNSHVNKCSDLSNMQSGCSSMSRTIISSCIKIEFFTTFEGKIRKGHTPRTMLSLSIRLILLDRFGKTEKLHLRQVRASGTL